MAGKIDKQFKKTVKRFAKEMKTQDKALNAGFSTVKGFKIYRAFHLASRGAQIGTYVWTRMSLRNPLAASQLDPYRKNIKDSLEIAGQIKGHEYDANHPGESIYDPYRMPEIDESHIAYVDIDNKENYEFLNKFYEDSSYENSSKDMNYTTNEEYLKKFDDSEKLDLDKSLKGEQTSSASEENGAGNSASVSQDM